MTTPLVLWLAAMALIFAAYFCSQTNERPLAGVLNAAAIVITLMGCVSAYLTYAT